MSEPSLELSIGDTFELTATVFPEDTDTKTTLVADGTVEWCPKDEISVFYGNGSNGGSRFTSQNTEQAPVVDFKGCLEDVSIGGRKFYGREISLWYLSVF